jgi:hypothetical protein
VFVELLNFHAHSDRAINVYLKEFTTNYINQKQAYIVNITTVNIESYTDGFTDPTYATIYAVDYDLNIFSSVSVMNLLVNGTLNLSDKINVDGLTTDEITTMQATDSTIYLLRSNLVINNLHIYRDIATENQKATNFIKAIYLQEKMVTVKNAYFQISGFILDTIDPASIHVENVYVDFHATMGGFVMRTFCNYPEAYTDGTVTFNNVTVENPIERIAPFREAILVNSGPEHLYVNDTNILFWGQLSEDKGQVEKFLNSG